MAHEGRAYGPFEPAVGPAGRADHAQQHGLLRKPRVSRVGAVEGEYPGGRDGAAVRGGLQEASRGGGYQRSMMIEMMTMT